MGERVRSGRLRDLIRVRRGGELLLHDAIRLDGDFDAAMQRPADRQGRPWWRPWSMWRRCGRQLDAVRQALER